MSGLIMQHEIKISDLVEQLTSELAPRELLELFYDIADAVADENFDLGALGLFQERAQGWSR